MKNNRKFRKNTENQTTICKIRKKSNLYLPKYNLKTVLTAMEIQTILVSFKLQFI